MPRCRRGMSRATTVVVFGRRLLWRTARAGDRKPDRTMRASGGRPLVSENGFLRRIGLAEAAGRPDAAPRLAPRRSPACPARCSTCSPSSMPSSTTQEPYSLSRPDPREEICRPARGGAGWSAIARSVHRAPGPVTSLTAMSLRPGRRDDILSATDGALSELDGQMLLPLGDSRRTTSSPVRTRRGRRGRRALRRGRGPLPPLPRRRSGRLRRRLQPRQLPPRGRAPGEARRPTAGAQARSRVRRGVVQLRDPPRRRRAMPTARAGICRRRSARPRLCRRRLQPRRARIRRRQPDGGAPLVDPLPRARLHLRLGRNAPAAASTTSTSAQTRAQRRLMPSETFLFDGPDGCGRHHPPCPRRRRADGLRLDDRDGEGARRCRPSRRALRVRLHGEPPHGGRPQAAAPGRNADARISRRGEALAATGPLVIGGKSMGGRVASMVADELHDERPDRGLLCLGYPFHPPGQPDAAPHGAP